MAIRRYLSEASFDEADVKRLTAAYEGAIALLRLKDREDPLTDLIASKIIQVFRTGERDPAKICARALTELGVPLPE